MFTPIKISPQSRYCLVTHCDLHFLPSPDVCVVNIPDLSRILASHKISGLNVSKLKLLRLALKFHVFNLLRKARYVTLYF